MSWVARLDHGPHNPPPVQRHECTLLRHAPVVSADQTGSLDHHILGKLRLPALAPDGIAPDGIEPPDGIEQRGPAPPASGCISAASSAQSVRITQRIELVVRKSAILDVKFSAIQHRDGAGSLS